MERYKHVYNSSRRQSGAAPWLSWAYLPLSLLVLELMLQLTAGLPRNFAAILGAGLTAVSVGCLLDLLGKGQPLDRLCAAGAGDRLVPHRLFYG